MRKGPFCTMMLKRWGKWEKGGGGVWVRHERNWGTLNGRVGQREAVGKWNDCCLNTTADRKKGTKCLTWSAVKGSSFREGGGIREGGKGQDHRMWASLIKQWRHESIRESAECGGKKSHWKGV